MSNVMPFEKFEFIMTEIINYNSKSERISDFMQKEMCSDSYCYFDVGSGLLSVLISILADEFNCWFKHEYNPTLGMIRKELGLPVDEKEDTDFPKWWDSHARSWDNDIEYWLYETPKSIKINDKEIPIKTLKEFYDYLVTYCVDKKSDL